MVLQLGGLGEGLEVPRLKKSTCYEMLHGVSKLDGHFGTTQTMENGCEVRNMER
jgi:hypothetical protein